MKFKRIFIYLLFFILLLSSCSNSYSLYKKNNYEQAIALASMEKNPSVKDYFAKAMSYVALGRKEEAKESSLIYLLMSDDNQNRPFIADIFVDLKFSDYLNVLALRPTDGLKAQITLYKSYLNFKQPENAKNIVTYYLQNNLNIADLLTLLVNYPLDVDFIAERFVNWSNSLNNQDLSEFLELLLQFSKLSLINENCAKIMVQLTSKLDSLTNNDLCNCYWIIGNALNTLKDPTNAKKYWKAAYNLNPQNTELQKLVK